MRCYYFDSEQKQQGPFPDLWIAQLVASGTLDSNTQIWGEQIGEWTTWNDYVLKSKNYIECPFCGIQLSIETEYFERKLQCPECGNKFFVHTESSCLLWDLFNNIKNGETIASQVQQWILECNKLHSKKISSVAINDLGLLATEDINVLISERDEHRLSRINQIVSCQIFLLCCFVFNKQIKRTSILEFREYCILSGLSAAAFDKIFSCELSKAFIVVNRDNIDYNEIYYFKSIAEYYSNSITNGNWIYFLPTFNALIPWYRNAFLKNISSENYLKCLEELKKLVVLPDFMIYSRILKDAEFQKTLEKIICIKLESDNFSKADFSQLNEILVPLPFGMEWLYNSTLIQDTLCSCCLKNFDLLLQGKKQTFSDLAYDMLTDISTVDNKIAKKLLPIITGKKKSFKEIKQIFDLLELGGYGMSYGENLFTLKRIYPYFLSEDVSADYSFPILHAKQNELSCNSCKGHGKVLCPKCRGTKKMDCPECNGSGQVYSYKTHRYIYCPKCQGRQKITCDNNCQGDRNITGELQYYVKCKQCNGTKKVIGMQTVCRGSFNFGRDKCLIIDDNYQNVHFELPFRQTDPLKHMDQAMAMFCKGKDCFFFSDKTGNIFCGEHNFGTGIKPEYMIEVISKYYSKQIPNTLPEEPTVIQTAIGQKSPETNTVKLEDNEKLYLKSYIVANKDGIIDAAERKMLEYQALNILKLTPERISELEALAQFLEDGEI